MPEAEKNIDSKLDVGEANPSRRVDWVMVYDVKSSHQSAIVECESIFTKLHIPSVIREGINDNLPNSVDVQNFK